MANQVDDQSNNQGFYWQTARDSLLTPAALAIFQIALRHEGESFDQAKQEIDSEYEVTRRGSPSQRHGGNFQTFIRVFEEAGWMYLSSDGDKQILRVTPAGRQAEQLLIRIPDFLKAVPYFLVELLSRYQLNNPAHPEEIRNQTIREATARSNVFPYWTIWKIMRSCDDFITIEELRRFVFRIQRTEEIDGVISEIKEFRRDKQSGLSAEEINKKYRSPIEKSVGEPKYIMARAGIHIGKIPQLIEKEGQSTYRLNPAYHSFIDNILTNESVFKEYIDTDTWFRDYGKPIFLEEEYIPYSLSVDDEDALLTYSTISDDDQVWLQVGGLLQMDVRNILFVGPPGTSKTTYALSIGAKLVEYQVHRFHNIQFHQALGYEEFIIGYVPTEKPGESGSFVLKNKLFLKACEAARRDDPNNFHVLVIDELNRGDPSRIFGEALTYIERRDEPFELSYSAQRVAVPSNLVILATMNPLDKSIADLDQALDRRFEKVEMNPSELLLRKILIDQNGMSPALAGRIIGFFKVLNSELENRIGHAYFKDAKDLASLRKIWTHRVLPLVTKELRRDQSKRDRIVVAFNAAFPNDMEDTDTIDNI